jgi:octopine/nopaline transport system substrate-binding protein
MIARRYTYAWNRGYFATTVGSDLTSLLVLNRLDLDQPDRETQASLDTLIAALRGKRVGIHEKTIYETFADHFLKGVADIRIYNTETEQYADMVKGKLDAIFDSGASLYDFIQAKDGRGSGLTLFGPALTGGPFGHGAGVAMRRDNEALRARFDSAISAAKEDGTLARLALIWFGYNAASE